MLPSSSWKIGPCIGTTFCSVLPPLLIYSKFLLRTPLTRNPKSCPVPIVWLGRLADARVSWSLVMVKCWCCMQAERLTLSRCQWPGPRSNQALRYPPALSDGQTEDRYTDHLHTIPSPCPRCSTRLMCHSTCPVNQQARKITFTTASTRPCRSASQGCWASSLGKWRPWSRTSVL